LNHQIAIQFDDSLYEKPEHVAEVLNIQVVLNCSYYSSITFHWLPFIRCSNYEKLVFKHMRSSNHVEHNRK